MKWRKATYSNGEGSSCVEVGCAGSRRIAARDSKNPAGPRLHFDRPAFARLLEEIKNGRHDLPLAHDE
jgi:hypothetical protein